MNPHDEHDPRSEREPMDADPAVDRVWRDASTDVPPAAIDAAIIAAATAASAGTDRSVGDIAQARSAAVSIRSRRPRRFVQWGSLAVAASVAGLAFVLVPTLQRESNVTGHTSQASNVTGAESNVGDAKSNEAEVTPMAPGVRGAVDAGVTSAAGSELKRESMGPSMSPAVPAPASAAATAAAPASPAGQDNAGRPPLRDMYEDRALTEQEAAASSAPMVVPPPHEAPVAVDRSTAERIAPPAAAAKQSADAQVRPDPGAWAAQIAGLHSAGDLDSAATSLRNFRATYENADDYLPPTLREWARTVE